MNIDMDAMYVAQQLSLLMLYVFGCVLMVATIALTVMQVAREILGERKEEKG